VIPELPTLRGPLPTWEPAAGSGYAASLAADRAGLDRFGYVEEEYLLAGSADAFDPDGVRIATDVAYTTRVVLRRPAELSAFSGSVLLDPLHVINEAPASWMCAEWIMANGHAWVGVTIHNSSYVRRYGFPGGIDVLRRFDVGRYQTLHLAEFDRPPRLRSYPGPNTDSFALKWHMAMAHPQGYPIAAALAHLLKSTRELLEGRTQRVYGCGFSQTANFWRLFLDGGWHERMRLTDGGASIDAYALIVSPAPVHHPADAVLVNVLSESEMVGTIVQMQAQVPADSDVPPVRGIELPGAPHLIGDITGDSQDHQHTNEPYLAFLRSMFTNLDSWVRGGPPMPHVPRVQRDPRSIDSLGRDEHGNALGGLRPPWLEAPRAQYLPRCACRPTTGEVVPFTSDQLGRLYPSDSDYQRRWDRAVSRLLEDRLLLAEDGQIMTLYGRSWLRPAPSGHPTGG
jgi:hypothetical protein